MRAARILLALFAALPAAAQEPAIPACTPARAGAVACLSGKLCECRFERGGSLTGLRDGHRWDCGVLRPGCGEAPAPPGLPGALPFPLPGLILPLPGPEPPHASPWLR